MRNGKEVALVVDTILEPGPVCGIELTVQENDRTEAGRTNLTAGVSDEIERSDEQVT